jgi:flagellar motor switch protein FliM
VLSLGVPSQRALTVRIAGTPKFMGRLTAANRHAGLRIDDPVDGELVPEAGA